MPVVDGLLGETEGDCEGFGSEELFHDAMFLGKQSHDCPQYRKVVYRSLQAVTRAPIWYAANLLHKTRYVQVK